MGATLIRDGGEKPGARSPRDAGYAPGIARLDSCMLATITPGRAGPRRAEPGRAGPSWADRLRGPLLGSTLAEPTAPCGPRGPRRRPRVTHVWGGTQVPHSIVRAVLPSVPGYCLKVFSLQRSLMKNSRRCVGGWLPLPASACLCLPPLPLMRGLGLRTVFKLEGLEGRPCAALHAPLLNTRHLMKGSARVQTNGGA